MSDELSFEEIWSGNRVPLQRFIRSRVTSHADAEDLLQETSLKAFKGFPQLDDVSSSRPWLFQIARRTIADFYRKRSAAASLHADDLSQAEDILMVEQDLADCIEPFLQSLSVDVRRTLKAVHLDGYSQHEFAETEGLNYSAAKSRVQRARAALRRAFEECCVITVDRRGNLADCTYKPNVCRKC